MQLRRQTKLKVLVTVLLFSGCTTVQPGFHDQDLTKAEQVPAEENRVPPAEKSDDTDESSEISEVKISDTTKKIILGCLLLCNPVGAVLGINAVIEKWRPHSQVP